MINSIFKKFFKRHNLTKKGLTIISLVALLFVSIILVNYVKAVTTVEITTPPNPINNESPTVIVTSTPDSGLSISQVHLRVYPALETPSGDFTPCVTNSGTLGVIDSVITSGCRIPTAIDGTFKTQIRVVDSNNEVYYRETDSYIIDLTPPIVSINLLPGHSPIYLNYNDIEFTGTVSDNLTNIQKIEYVMLTSLSESGTWNPLAEIPTSCVFTGSSTSVTFSCDLMGVIDNIPGEEHRIYVRAVDEVNNTSTYNMYSFVVDTIDPTFSAINSPTSATIWYGNRSYDIEWVTPSDNFDIGSNPISIYYSEDDFISTTTIVENIAGAGPFNWYVNSDTHTTNAKIKIVAKDLSGNETVIVTDPFTIIRQTLPEIYIYPLEPINSYNATNTAPIITRVRVTDDDGVASANYEINSGSLSSCSLLAGYNWGDTLVELTCGSWVSPTEGSHVIYVYAEDSVGDANSNSRNFIYDITAPVVDQHENYVDIYLNQETVLYFDVCDVLTEPSQVINWSEISRPSGGNASFNYEYFYWPSSQCLEYSVAVSADVVDLVNPYYYRATYYDILGNSVNNDIRFYWTDQPLAFSVYNPAGGERLAGGNTFNSIQWTNPGGASLDHFDLEYSVNGGTDWTTLVDDISSTTVSYSWSIPSENSENVVIRVNAKNISNTTLVYADSAAFAIDSLAPVVDAGTLGAISLATAPGATASDNFDDEFELTYAWEKVSGPGTVNFVGGANSLNPSISGTLSGNYEARLTVTDRAGNSATDTVTFDWDGTPANFSIVYPAGAEWFAGTSTVPITWQQPSPSPSYYKIFYSLDNWTSSTTITASTPGTASSTNRYFNWVLPSLNSNQVRVRVTAVDSYGNEGSANSAAFGIDSIAPTVDAGNFYNVVLGPTQPGATASDAGSGIAGYSWTKISGPGTISFGGGANTLNPAIYADVPGIYVARLTVTDNVGLSSYDEIAFIVNTNPPTVIITSPAVDAYWRGGTNRNIQWVLDIDPGNLGNFQIDYSLNSGSSWTNISSTVASTSRLFNWTVPMENSSTSLMRVITTNTEGKTATATNQFIIDSEAPVITIGGIGTTTVATTTETTVTDNIDDPNDLTYLWTAISVPPGGTLTFSPTNRVMNPTMSGTVTGYYTAQIIVFDRAGHISTDTVTFYWEGNPDIPIVTNPTSTAIIKGGNTQLIEWYMPEPDPGDLDYFDLSYSTNGTTWNLITSGLSSTTRDYLWTVPEALNSTSTVVKVEIYDIDTNLSYGISPNFTLDSTPPVVNTGTISSPISAATSSVGVIATDNFDDEEFISFNWTVLSEPYANATLTIASSTATSTEFYGDISGLYEVLLSATDRAGNVGTSSLSFIWLNEFDPLLIEPKTGDHIKGNATSTAIWTFNDPGDLDRIEAFYSVDNGDNWVTVNNSIASTSMSIVWNVPEVNSTSSLFRIVTVDTSSRRATSTSGLFTIDSEAPYVDAGEFIGDVNSPTAPNASSTDNFSLPEEMTYVWTPSSLNYGGGSDILNPAISAGSNGTYTATLTVYDKAGNFASDTVTFTRNVSTPSSGGPGGPGGPSTTTCSEVTYGDWSDCFNGFQTRSIISSVPSSCTPTAAQQALQTQVCGGGSLNYCTDVIYGEWGDCINGRQIRPIVNQYPASCIYTSEQQAATEKSCGGEPFDIDALDVMEQARKDFTKEDPALVKRLMGQILIQVEELGRAWYVNPNDGRRYYLGSPTNAFSVMSLIGKGIKNDLLKKLPIGLLDPKLSNDKDTDGDGLTDRLEEGIGTDLFKKDTDGDGYSDYEEVMAGYDPLDPAPKKSIIDQKLLAANLGQIFIQVETNGEAWYVEPRSKKRYYLGRPLEAFNIMRQFGIGITNEDLNKIPVGQFTDAQMRKITEMLEERKRRIEAEAAAKR